MSSVQDILLAVAAGDIDTTKALLVRDPQIVNAKGERDITPLIVAARYGRTEIADLLLTNGATIEANDSAHSSTPLIWAAFFGHPETVALLLSRGADINARNSYGSTALAVVNQGEHGSWQKSTPTAPEIYHSLAILLQKHGGNE